MNNKGMTSSVINWIFVIIAGAAILLFFFRIITVHGDIVQSENTVRLLKDMEDLLVGKSLSTDTSSLVKINGMDFQIKCSLPCNSRTGCDSEISVGTNSVPTRTQSIFSKQSIRSDELLAFASGWDMPFQATNFLYLAVPAQRISFPSSCTGECNRIWQKIPQAFKDKKSVVKGGDGLWKISFDICLATTEKSVCIDTTSQKIYFYENNQLLNSAEFASGYPYLKDEEILGAIFSGEPLMYECNLNKAYYRLDRVKDTLMGKALDMMVYYVDNNKLYCRQDLDEIRTILYHMPASFNPSINPHPLQTNLTNLQNFNNKLRRNSCSSVY